MNGTRQTIPAGTILFRPGDPCPGFVVLHEGSLRVTLAAANGREVVLYRVSPGDVCLQTFACLVEGRKYSALGVAESELLADILEPPEFHAVMARDEAFRQRVFAAVARRFADFEQLVEDVALTGFEARLARALLRLAGPGAVVRATHEQLATETGSGRAVVSRQLAAFAAAGHVALQRGLVTLTDRAALARIARERQRVAGNPDRPAERRK
ncbi:Crp/Fnr family transcriptional regulator [Thioalkalivibrio sp. XN279]|uniref:Crp/Fnr family transcriptional regulator n=1 Tax=Thioalkalivibrio sp. XN279 TaxID=2714953 RepID=UPI00140CFC6B|nr:Crp/Fnr family transcriptional regulator [Thioalkalivibrio sp. XN279]